MKRSIHAPFPPAASRGQRRVRRACGRLCALLELATLAWAQSPPPGGGTTSSVTYYATYKLDGGTATQSNQSYTATAADTSAVWATNSGVLTLIAPTITTSGNTSSQDNSSFYGLNAGLLATASASVTVTGGTISTTGLGANGAFATGSGSSVTLSNMTIKATAGGGHGVMATQGGKMTLTNVDMRTDGSNSAAIATDRGGGTITATGGTILTTGQDSPGLYSTGTLDVTGATISSTGAEMAVIEGANSITLTNTALSTTKEKWGVMIYQSMSGDASGNKGTFTMTGGSLNYAPSSGPLFYVTNSTGVIGLKGVAITSGSGVLVKAAAGNWGNSGSNGGNAVLTADSQTLSGSMTADSISSVSATLKNNSKLTGTLTKVSLTLDSTSSWTVTGASVLTSLTGAAISGTSITNLIGNGNAVTYDSTLSANQYLGGLTYTLQNGGTLAPSGGSSGGTTTAPTLASISPTSAVAGSAAFTLVATGTGFVSGSQLRWNTTALSTSFISATSLTATVPAALVASATTASISVLNPDATTTGALTFSVTAPQATFSIASTGVIAGTVNQALSPTVQLTASGGVSPINWSATGMPAGLSLSSAGLISGTPTVAGQFTAQVTATDAVGTKTTSSVVFSILSVSFSTISYLPHLAYQNDATGNWAMDVYLTNPGTSAVQVALTFHPNVTVTGSKSTALPLLNGGVSVAGQTLTIAAGATLHLTTPTGTASPLVSGWAQVDSSGALGGQAIFRHLVNGSFYEGTVALSPAVTSFSFPYDLSILNGSQIQIGYAIGNVSASAATSVTCALLDPAGKAIQVSGSPSFNVQVDAADQQIGLLESRFNNWQGLARCTASSPVAVLALRMLGDGPLTSLSVLSGN